MRQHLLVGSDAGASVVFAELLAIAVSAWGVQCDVDVRWQERIVAGYAPATQTIYPTGTQIPAHADPARCRVYMSRRIWRNSNASFRCYVVMRVVGQVAGKPQRRLPRRNYAACRR